MSKSEDYLLKLALKTGIAFRHGISFPNQHGWSQFRGTSAVWTLALVLSLPNLKPLTLYRR